LFPASNWWNLDISAAPVDPGSNAFINYIGATRGLHPDFGGDAGGTDIYGMPYIVVDGTQPKRAVTFEYSDESDGVNHDTDQSFPFYPIPDEAITQAKWIEGGAPGNVNTGGDRHMLIVDKDNKHLYELFALYHNGTGWVAGSGAFFDLNINGRRPEGWTSADAAGLAILPGLVRYDEVYGTAEINHAFRVTLQRANGYVYPASHVAGTYAGAVPMGGRLRLKASKDISGFSPEIQRLFRAFKKYGLIMADNGSNMYISGTYDTRWDNDILNPAFAALKAGDFEVIQLGYQQATAPAPTVSGVAPSSGSSSGGTSVTITGTGFSAGATATFGGTAATGVSVLSPTSLTCSTPARSPGLVDVSVSNADGQTGTKTGAFTYTGTTTPCTPGDTSLCLNASRFQLTVTWKNPYDGGTTGVGHAVPLTTDTGYFWFFLATNVELVIKVLDGRPVNGHFWVFTGALSDVEYTITVRDSQTGAVKTYFNPGRTLASKSDTAAF